MTRAPGATGGFTELDPVTAAPLRHEVVNAPADLSFEAYWSIHLVGGEESHTARPLVLQGTTAAPAGLTAAAADGARRRTGVDGAAVPAARHRLRGGAGGGRGLHRGRADVRGRGRRPELHGHDGASGGQSYFYRVRTEAAAGWSPWSAAAEVSLP